MSDLADFARERGMNICETGLEVTVITARAVPDLVVEVTIAQTVQEWFIEVREAMTGTKVFEDWCDHQGYDDSTAEELRRELYEAVTSFLSTVQGATLRVRRQPGCFGVPQLETLTDAGWKNVWDQSGSKGTRG